MSKTHMTQTCPQGSANTTTHSRGTRNQEDKGRATLTQRRNCYQRDTRESLRVTGSSTQPGSWTGLTCAEDNTVGWYKPPPNWALNRRNRLGSYQAKTNLLGSNRR